MTWDFSHLAFIQDAELRYTWVFDPVGGPDCESMLGKTDRELFAPELAARLELLKHKALREGALQAEVEVEESGRLRIFELILAPSPKDGLRGMMADITARVRQRAQAATTARDLRSIVEGEWMSFVVLGPDRRVRLASAGARQSAQLLFGRLLEAGMAFDDLVPPERMASFLLHVEQALLGHSVEADTSFPSSTGPRHFRHHYGPIRDSFAVITGVLILTVEMTALRQAEAGRADSERQLRHAQRLESLGLLAAGVAHDFNNLLMSVLGNADAVLADQQLAEGLKEPLEDIKSGAQKASELTRQLLAYAGKSKPAIERVDLNRMVSEMVQLLRVSLLKGTRLTLELDAAVPTIEADRSQVQQVVMNLVGNAAEAVDHQGTVRISTSTAFLQTAPAAGLYRAPWIPGEYTVLTVEDNGPGIPAEAQTRIFDPFFTTKFSGRGLGLSSVLGIVHAHQGSIRVESSPSGTKMVVHLPVSQRLQETTPPPILASEAGLARVLVVDDDPGVRRALQRQLRRLGYDTEVVDSGAAALARLEAHSDCFRLVILDRTMPGMTGEEVLAVLRDQYPHLKVLLVSGLAAPENEPGGPRPDGFLPKPFTIEDLRQELSLILNEEAAESDLEANG